MTRRFGARARALLAELAADALSEPRFALRRLGLRLRRERWLGAWERRGVSDGVAAVVRLQRLIVFALAHGMMREDGLPDAALALSKGLPAWDRDAMEVALFALPEPARTATRHGITDALAGRLLAERTDVDALLIASNQRAPLVVRANRLRCTASELSARLRAEGVATVPAALAEDALVVVGHPNVEGTSPFREGWFEPQDEASQLVAALCEAPVGAVVLDACAGAGGKTLALASRARGHIRLVACDVDAGRLAELGRRAARAGARIDARSPDALGDLAAEVVLVDAPCSGSGTLRRDPGLRHALEGAALDAHPPVQRAVLGRYAEHVRPGGRLVYATCSLLCAENQEVVAAFLEQNAAFRQVPLVELLGRERALAIGDGALLQMAPHTHGTDGFFAAVLGRLP